MQIPSGISEIGRGVFKASKFTSLNIPSNIKEIKINAFNGCVQLKEVTMEDGVEVIGESAFAGCDVLEKVTLASTVQSIGSDAFRECPKLKEIFIPESVTEIDPYAFYMSENVTIYTPAGSYAESFAIENNIPYVNQ